MVDYCDFSQLLPIEWARERRYDGDIGCRLVPGIIVKQEMGSMDIHCGSDGERFGFHLDIADDGYEICKCDFIYLLHEQRHT